MHMVSDFLYSSKTFPLIWHFLLILFVGIKGNILLKLVMKMSSEIESNAQFDMLHVLLCLFLDDERTLNYFIHNCVISIIVFAESLFEKEPTWKTTRGCSSKFHCLQDHITCEVSKCQHSPEDRDCLRS